jgi:hypothetical protein
VAEARVSIGRALWGSLFHVLGAVWVFLVLHPTTGLLGVPHAALLAGVAAGSIALLAWRFPAWW